MIKVTNLWKVFKAPQGKLEILKGIDFEVKKGQMVFIVGRSGAGKSTLLHLLGGLDKPTKGRIELDGKDIHALGERKLDRLRNQRFGFVFQFYHLLPELTIQENVELPSMIAGKRESRYADELIKRVGLWERRKHLPKELSGGERQRVAIARALINRPDIVFCDEPTGNLDDETAEAIQSLVLELNREGQTFCIVTHEDSFAGQGSGILKLHEGTLEPWKFSNN